MGPTAFAEFLAHSYEHKSLPEVSRMAAVEGLTVYVEQRLIIRNNDQKSIVLKFFTHTYILYGGYCSKIILYQQKQKILCVQNNQ
jgi:hypothetical protein